MPGVTDRERAVLHLIARSIEASGCQPSYRAIAKHFGWASLNSVAQVSRSLRKKGVVAIHGARAWSFDWTKYLTEEGNDSQGTDGSCPRHASRCDVRRDGRRGGDRHDRQARSPRGGLE